MSVKSGFPVHVRGIAAVLLFAMFHYVAGYRLLYSLGILYTKDEAKQCMVNESTLKKITLPIADYNSLKWSEENKEFSFNNEMYDVVSIQKTGDTYNITAYLDDPETELVTAFHHFESELFHPDQTNKSAKSAEDIMASFQKDFTPTSEFKIDILAHTGLVYNVIAVQQQHPLDVSDNIWHPPTNC